MYQPKILVTGANGQLGRVLTEALREKYGKSAIIASDINEAKEGVENYIFLDIINTERIKEVVADYGITEIYHMAAILSASGEWNPAKTWNVNFNALLNILEITKDMGLKKLFFPSTIAVFGMTTPRINTPQDSPLLPTTVYGISKSAGELWCNYYHQRYGLDVRSLRYPGIIGWQSLPSGGTTDYAVEIFHEALKEGKYTCFLGPDTALPMMFIDDAIRATIELMAAPSEQIKTRYGYNLAAMTFTPSELAISIRKQIPDLEVTYEPDFRQAIAESWTASIDDSRAREEWGWQHDYDLEKMTDIMLEKLRKLLKIN
jgi:threonine 3-dehydrogenase